MCKYIFSVYQCGCLDANRIRKSSACEAFHRNLPYAYHVKCPDSELVYLEFPRTVGSCGVCFQTLERDDFIYYYPIYFTDNNDWVPEPIVPQGSFHAHVADGPSSLIAEAAADSEDEDFEDEDSEEVEEMEISEDEQDSVEAAGASEEEEEADDEESGDNGSSNDSSSDSDSGSDEGPKPRYLCQLRPAGLSSKSGLGKRKRGH